MLGPDVPPSELASHSAKELEVLHLLATGLPGPENLTTVQLLNGASIVRIELREYIDLMFRQGRG